MTAIKSRIIRRCLLAVVLAGVWWFVSADFRKNWNWPLSLLFGAMAVFVIVYGGRKPAPFQLVLRLADDKAGDHEDDQTFETLHDRFKHLFSKSGSIQFDGFDTDGSFIWFYFLGPDEASVRHAV